ncbi:MAG: hypothetical protein IJT30_04700 [Muribaculaceae bacterium]|nr:hypothetical protein [Muribaculaceae bacterium]
MNGNRNHLFRLTCGAEEVHNGHTTFANIRRVGDRLATERRQHVRLEAYNTSLYRWEHLGTFMGNREYVNAFGELRVMSEDYRSMVTKKGGES